MRATALPILLLLALALPARAEDAITLFDRHKTYFCGHKEITAKTRAIGPNGEMVMSSGGDLFTDFVQQVYNKLAQLKDTPSATRILPGIREWTDKRRKRIVELEAACGKEDDALQQALAAFADAKEVPQAAIRRWLDLEAKSSKTDRTDLQVILEGLFTASRGSGANGVAGTRRALLELEGFFARLRDADRWGVLELGWLAREADLSEQGLHDHPEFAWRRGWEDLPGAEGMMVRRRDLAALQRIVEDQVVVERPDPSEFGRVDTPDAVRSLSPGVRAAWRELIQGLGDTPGCAKLLERSLLAPYDLLFVEHQLFKYSGQGPAKPVSYIPDLVKVLRNWSERHEEWDGEPGRLGMLEVMHFRQGAVHTAHSAGDRFIAPMVEPVDKLKIDRERARVVAQRMVNEILGDMKYGGTASLAESFEKKTADCFRDTEMAATLLANAGHDGIYPLMWRADGMGHMINAMVFDDRVECFDCYMQAGSRVGDFPDDFREHMSNHVSVWHRALDTWIEWQILLVKEGKLVKQEIPYYGQKGSEEDLK